MASYRKPDVEVLQEFRNLNPVVNRAELQSVIVGSAFQLIRNAKIGSYDGNYAELPYPGELLVTSIVDQESIEVYVSNYAGLNKIERSVVRIQSNSGTFATVANQFVDYNADFSNVVASTQPGDHDGDYVRILYGPKAGFYEIQQVVDSHTLVLDSNLGSDLTGLDYVIASFGFIPAANGIQLAPRLTSSGVVQVNLNARRTDYTAKLIMANTLEDLQNIFGKDAIVPENPLAYGMMKAMAPLGPNDIILGIMVEEESAEGYQKALDVLETEEVYCMVPLSFDPIVHQLFSEHCQKMSDVLEKRERICLFNTDRHTRVIKQGYFGIPDPVSGVLGHSNCNIVHSGIPLADDVQFSYQTLDADGTSTPQVLTIPNEPRRMLVLFRPKADYSASYTLHSAPATEVPFTVDQDGKFVVEAAEGDYLETVTFTSTAVHAEKFVVYSMLTVSEPDEALYTYPVLMNPGVQMFDPYYNLPPTSDYRALKVRYYNPADPTDDSLEGLLPEGMTLRVHYGNGLVRDIKYSGTYQFTGALQSIYTFNNNGAVGIDSHLIEIMILPNAGTYSVNTIHDELATYLSSKVQTGDEVVIESGDNIGTYLVSRVVSETQLEIQGFFATEDLDIEYRIQSPIITDKNELASWYADISKSFGRRRTTHILAPYVGVNNDAGEIIAVPGYYLSCAYAGITQSDLPQNGFTNRPIPGFNRVFFTNDYFTERQLDTISEGGTTVIVQNRALAPLSARHQLTTDMTSIETREYSVTKDVDFMAKSARNSFRPYIGRFLINEVTLTTLYSVGNALIQRWIRDGQLISGSVSKFYVDPTQADKVLACFYLKVPIPLNYIRLIFVI